MPLTIGSRGVPLWLAHRRRLTDGLVGFWNLEDETDALGVHDMSNVSATAFASGKVGNAMVGDGSADFLVHGSTPALSVTGSFTLTAWVRPGVLGNSQAVVCKGPLNNAAIEYGILLTSGNKYRVEHHRGAQYLSTTGSPSAQVDTWAFVCGRHDVVSGVTTTFVDDTRVDESDAGGTEPIDNSGRDFTIGAKRTSAGGAGLDFFNGLIDAVGLWNRPLTDREVELLYNGGNGRQWPL
jgi:hypothetical protein